MTRLESLRDLMSHGPHCYCVQCVSERAAIAQMQGAPVNTAASEPPPSPLEDYFAEALASLLKAQHDLDAVTLQYRHDRRRIAAVLATFAASPISVSSLQPILDLAAEMNKETR